MLPREEDVHRGCFFVLIQPYCSQCVDETNIYEDIYDILRYM